MNNNLIELCIIVGAYFDAILVKRGLVLIIVNNIDSNIHESMIKQILKAKISYFDSIPSGRIISRFSNDLSNLDIGLSKAVIDSLEVICNSFVLIASIILLNPYFLIVTFIISLILYGFFIVSKSTITAKKELEMSLSLNVLSYFSSSMNELCQINVYNQSR